MFRAPLLGGAFGAHSFPPGHEDSEYVLSFEIGLRESGFYSERKESQTDRITEPSSIVLVYRCRKSHSIQMFAYNQIEYILLI